MSQNIRASGVLGSPHGSSSNVSASGMARTSASWMREKPSIDEPSNVMPSSRAFSSSAGLMAKLLRLPRMSVNHRRISRTPRSSTVRRTYSRCCSSISLKSGRLGGRGCGAGRRHRRSDRRTISGGPRAVCWRSGDGPRGSPCRR